MCCTCVPLSLCGHPFDILTEYMRKSNNVPARDSERKRTSSGAVETGKHEPRIQSDYAWRKIHVFKCIGQSGDKRQLFQFTYCLLKLFLCGKKKS